MSIYCRLCAEQKAPNQIKSVITDEDITSKLMYCCEWMQQSRCNNEISFQDVCKLCYQNLDKCWNFLKSIESAQEKLRWIQDENQEYQMNIERNLEHTDFEERIHFPEQIKIEENFDEEDLQQEELIVINQIEGYNEEFKWNNEINSEGEEDGTIISSHQEQEEENEDQAQQMDSTFYCYLCSKVFGKFPSLKYHMVIHTTPKQFPCKYCSLSFRTKRLYNHHEKVHVDYFCEICQKRYPSAFTLKVHNRMHVGSSVRLYGCVECDHYFTDVSAFYGHMKKKHGLDSNEAKKVAKYIEPNGEPKPFACDQCGKSFGDKNKLRNHKVLHSDERPYKCKLCPKAFKNKYNMRYHQMRHSGSGKFNCSECDRKFSKRKTLLKHMETHNEYFEKPFPCDSCDRLFKSLRGLRTHHSKTHTTDSNLAKTDTNHEELVQLPVEVKIEENIQEEEINVNQIQRDQRNECRKSNEEIQQTDSPFYCYLCSKTFGKFPSLKYHMIVHTTPKQYPCKYCNAKFRTKRQYNHHEKIHVDYFCEICQKQYPSAFTLKAHSRMHIGSSARLFGCVECDHYFLDGSAFYGHMKKKHGLDSNEAKKVVKYIEPNGDAKQFVCDQCGKSFQANHNLRNHLVVHSNDRPYKCKKCPKTFKNKYYMRQHQLSHTGENKQYSCYLCSRNLSSKTVLRRHMETHTGVFRKTYPCDFCDRIFRQTYELKCHRRTHTGEKPYKCDACSMSMTTESQLKRHCKTQTHLKRVSDLMNEQEQTAHGGQYYEQQL